MAQPAQLMASPRFPLLISCSPLNRGRSWGSKCIQVPAHCASCGAHCGSDRYRLVYPQVRSPCDGVELHDHPPGFDRVRHLVRCEKKLVRVSWGPRIKAVLGQLRIAASYRAIAFSMCRTTWLFRLCESISPALLEGDCLVKAALFGDPHCSRLVG